MAQIIPLDESRLESFYVGLTEEQQKTFVLIEDCPGGELQISYGGDTIKHEVITPKMLNLLASSWPAHWVVVRTDSHRFVSAEQGLWDSQDILEARSVCKKILELVPSGPTRDRIDGHLQDLIIMMQSLEESNLGLFDLNNELDAEISQHDPQPYNPSYEFVHEQSPEWNIDAESILEPTQEEISDTPESKTSKKRQLPPKATPKQLQP